MSEYIHGPTDTDEVARLEHQAVFIGARSLLGFAARQGDLVLDLGTGVGAMAGQLLHHYPGIRVVGLDRQRSALQTAQANHPEAIYVVGDAMDLPFPDGAFDHVHGSWIIEHVPDPVVALREVRRVLKPGGTCRFLEVDNASLHTMPEYAEVVTVMTALNESQVVANAGDPFIGQRLKELLAAAGFSDVEAHPLKILGSAANPVHYRDFSRVFVDIFESVEGLLGTAMAPIIRAAAERIRTLPDVPGSELHYSPVVASASRGER
jgi:ubiquinone/menaquinone biosynthesis C-methylase UbiE